jgi:hypothetical protein
MWHVHFIFTNTHFYKKQNRKKNLSFSISNIKERERKEGNISVHESIWYNKSVKSTFTFFLYVWVFKKESESKGKNKIKITKTCEKDYVPRRQKKGNKVVPLNFPFRKSHESDAFDFFNRWHFIILRKKEEKIVYILN